MNYNYYLSAIIIKQININKNIIIKMTTVEERVINAQIKPILEKMVYQIMKDRPKNVVS